MNEEVKKYEFAYLLKSEEDYKEILKGVKDAGVQVASEGQMAKIKLAYPIKKETFAYFGYLHLIASPQDIKRLSEAIRNNLKILRFIIFIKPVIRPMGVEKPKRARGILEPQERVKASDVSPRPTAPTAPSRAQNLSNEALEKKLEEILK